MGGQSRLLIIDHNPVRAEMLNRRGIICESGTGKRKIFTVPVKSQLEQISSFDILLFCVKSYDLTTSLAFVRPLLSLSTLCVFLQNGIGHLQFNDSSRLHAIPVFATSSEGATRLGDGHIHHAGKGQTSLGFLTAQGKQAERQLQKLLMFLQNGGFHSNVAENILTKIWAKLFVNVGINALTATHNISNGQLLSSPVIRAKLEQLVQEAEKVAQACGITIEQDPVQAALSICKSTADNISSMLQDVRNLRPTEIAAINGAISNLGQQHGVPTPLNDEICLQIKKIEREYRS